MKLIEGGNVFILMFYERDEDPCICNVYGCRELAVAEMRKRNKRFVDSKFLTDEGDFDFDHYDCDDTSYYDVLNFELIC